MKIGRHSIYVEDCLLGLRRLDSESVSAIVTDPPYGLGKPPEVEAMLRAWLDGGVYQPGGTGFMGEEWDSFVPPPEVFRELLRISKPGAHALVFAGSRTFDLMALSMRIAGWEIRDGISYLYGSGFPKSTDLSKQIDRLHGAEREVIGQKGGRYEHAAPGTTANPMGQIEGGGGDWAKAGQITAPATEDALRFEGWGSALKPGWEPIIMARKPLAGTLASNALAHGCGGLNIDGCRVEHASAEDPAAHQSGVAATKAKGGTRKGSWCNPNDLSGASDVSTRGRWPANVILQHLDGCRCDGIKKVRTQWGQPTETGNPKNRSVYNGGWRAEDKPVGYADADGKESIANWICEPGCPVAGLDEQSGVSGSNWSANKGKGVGYGSTARSDRGSAGHADSGGASRFFYCAKPSRAEREAGCESLPESESGRRNIHPTVKPLALLRHLVRLVCPPDGVVCDPFSGSGSTLIAAEREGIASIGFERESKYAEIASHRLRHWIRLSAMERLQARTSRPRPPTRSRK